MCSIFVLGESEHCHAILGEAATVKSRPVVKDQSHLRVSCFAGESLQLGYDPMTAPVGGENESEKKGIFSCVGAQRTERKF